MQTVTKKELLIVLFRAYFYYGKFKYAEQTKNEVRLARLAACRGVMRLCRRLLKEDIPVTKEQLAEQCLRLRLETGRLPFGDFRAAYEETAHSLCRH